MEVHVNRWVAEEHLLLVNCFKDPDEEDGGGDYRLRPNDFLLNAAVVLFCKCHFPKLLIQMPFDRQGCMEASYIIGCAFTLICPIIISIYTL